MDGENTTDTAPESPLLGLHAKLYVVGSRMGFCRANWLGQRHRCGLLRNVNLAELVGKKKAVLELRHSSAKRAD